MKTLIAVLTGINKFEIRKKMKHKRGKTDNSNVPLLDFRKLDKDKKRKVKVKPIEEKKESQNNKRVKKDFHGKNLSEKKKESLNENTKNKDSIKTLQKKMSDKIKKILDAEDKEKEKKSSNIVLKIPSNKEIIEAENRESKEGKEDHQQRIIDLKRKEKQLTSQMKELNVEKEIKEYQTFGK